MSQEALFADGNYRKWSDYHGAPCIDFNQHGDNDGFFSAAFLVTHFKAVHLSEEVLIPPFDGICDLVMKIDNTRVTIFHDVWTLGWKADTETLRDQLYDSIPLYAKNEIDPSLIQTIKTQAAQAMAAKLRQGFNKR